MIGTAALFALLYVTNERAGTVQVIDTKIDRVVMRAAVGNRPRGLAISPDGKRLYVATSWWRGRPHTGPEAVIALDAATLKVVRKYTTGGTDPECVAVSPDGTRLYLSNEEAGTASIVDVGTGARRATLIVGTEPEGVTASPDGRWVYVTAETSNVLTVIDARAEKTAANILVDSRPRAMIFARDAARGWASAEIGGTVLEIDAKKHRLLRRVKLASGDKPVGLALSPDEKTLYVATGRGNGVVAIDTKTARILTRTPTGSRVWGIAIAPDGRKLYAANSLSNTVSVIDTKTHKVIATIPTDDGPWALAVR